MSPLAILIPLLLIALSACQSSPAPAQSAAPIEMARAEPPIAEPARAPAADPLPAAPTTPAELISPAAPAPPSIPMPAHLVFKADPWPSPSIGLAGFMVRKMPLEFSSGDPNAKWFTNPTAGLGGFDCIDPAPNAGYHVDDGCLVMTPGLPPNPGFPVISAQTFSTDHHTAIVSEIWFDDAGSPGCYAGPVFDNGEDNYFALYGGNTAEGQVQLFVDQAAKGSQAMAPLAIKTWHTFQIHYYPDDSWRIAVNGTEYFPTGIDNPMKLHNRPHLSCFAGGWKAVKFRKLEVWSDDAAATEA